jgi:hypothetical protein
MGRLQMKPLLKEQLTQESKKKIVQLPTNDIQLYEKLMTKSPSNPKASGDMHFPGHNGIWGEWIASQGRWTDARFFVSAIRGYPKTNRMSFAKAWMVKCLRQGRLK